jgi:hypothetical protein
MVVLLKILFAARVPGSKVRMHHLRNSLIVAKVGSLSRAKIPSSLVKDGSARVRPAEKRRAARRTPLCRRLERSPKGEATDL